jgi:hypothetical protein
LYIILLIILGVVSIVPCDYYGAGNQRVPPFCMTTFTLSFHQLKACPPKICP